MSDSFATSASRIADGKSSIISIFPRIAGRWPCRSAMRLYEIGSSLADAFAISSRQRRRSRLRQSLRRPDGKLGAPRDCALHLGIARGDDVNEISVDQKRRIFENGSRDRGLVDRQRLYNDGRRTGAACEHIGHGLTYKRRGIVKQAAKKAPSAAARSSSDKSEISQARASDRVASARPPAGAVRIQPMNCRTIMVLLTDATRNDTMAHGHYQRRQAMAINSSLSVGGFCLPGASDVSRRPAGALAEARHKQKRAVQWPGRLPSRSVDNSSVP